MRQLKRKIGALEGELLQREQAADELRVQRLAEARSKIAVAERVRDEALQRCRAAEAQADRLTKELKRQGEALAAAEEAARNSIYSLRNMTRSVTKAEALAEARAGTVATLEAQLTDLAELFSSSQQELDKKVSVRDEKLAALKSKILPSWMADRNPPERTFNGDPTSMSALEQYRKKATAHMATVLRGRGEGDAIEHIAAAIANADPSYPERLMGTPQFSKLQGKLARQVVDAVQSHWTTLLAVHIWDRLDLSRSQFETLRHLLSFVYDVDTDKFAPIKVWVNEHDPSDFVLAARLAARKAREDKYHELAEQQNIIVGPNGRCQRDVGTAICDIYTNNAAALRSHYSLARPAQPVLYLDGTGSCIGRGLGHAEVGCADFIKGVKQSRRTLAPVAAWEGNDHRPDQEENLDVVMPSFNRAVLNPVLKLEGREGIPMRPITVADMQGTKATYGMSLSTHSVWCTCGVDTQHSFPKADVQTYDEMVSYIEKIGCEFKTEKQMCAWAHYSYSVHRGGKFKQFACDCCGYAPTEREWQADLRKFEALSDDDRIEAQRQHVAKGEHHHQQLFSPPLPYLGMKDAGVDNLHLIYLNVFKHIFKYTIHEGLPESNKKAVAAYLSEQHFYSYDAKSKDEDPCSHWIGREVKRFIKEASIHLPVLLRLAHAPADVVDELNEKLNGAHPALPCIRI